jgi:hypothetical protein
VNVRSVRERAAFARKDQVEVDPAFPCCKALDGLAATVRAERVDDDRRHEQRPLASLRFCLDELRALMGDSL